MRYLFAILLLFHAEGKAGDSLSIPARIAGDALTVLNDGGEYFTAPLHASGSGWLVAGALAGGVGLSSAADNPLRNPVMSSRSAAGDNLASFGSRYGNAVYGIGFSGILYAAGLWSGNRPWSETGMLLFESIACAGITTTVVKTVVGRSRPSTGDGPGRFHPWTFDDDHLSFPSGHSTVAFAVSSVLARRADNAIVTVLLYSAAVVTSWSRMYNDEHWLSDNLAGAIIGISAGLSVGSRRLGGGAEGAFRIEPAGAGLRAEYRF